MPPLEDSRRDTKEQQQINPSNQSAATDSLRQEAFQRVDQTTVRPDQGIERRSVNSVLSQNFDNPVSHLDNARTSLKRGDFQGAEREYFAAIVAADKIDPREVAQEREKVKQALTSEQDPTRRRQLVDWDMTLGDMQRAPGFTRANLGLCYIRMGYHLEGHRMLVEAARRDPQMENDPNFIRRLQALGRPMPGREGGAPGAMDSQGRPIQPGQPARPGDTSVAPPPDGRTTPAQVERVELPSGTNRHDAPNFDNPFSHIAKANESFAKGGGKLPPEARAEYEAAKNAADSVDRKYLGDQIKTLQEALVKAYPPETDARVTAMEKERDTMLNALPQAKQDSLKALATKRAQATTPEEQATIEKQMKDLLGPDIVKKQDDIDAQTAQARAIQEQLAALKHLHNSSALSRFAYAEALRQSGDKANAKILLEQVAKYDPEATKDDKFKLAAADVGLTLRPATTAGTDQSGQAARPGDQAGRPADQPVTGTTTGAAVDDPRQLLAQANDVNTKQGYAAAKPLFDKAITAADNVDPKVVDDNLKNVEEKFNKESDPKKKEELQTLGQMWAFYKNSPTITRFQAAVAQNNSGDYAGAKTALDQLAAKTPDIAKDPAFTAVRDANGKQQKVSDQMLQAAAQTPAGGGDAGAVGDNPYTHIQQAVALFDPKDSTKQNAKSAEAEWKKAIDAADKLPVDQYTAKLAEVQQQLDAAKNDPLKSAELLKLKDGLKELVGLPASLRLETATFYLQNAKPDEAKAMLEKALQKDPTLKDQERFKQLTQISQENSKDTIDKALSFLKSTGKELVSDGVSGGAGLAAFALTPGGRVLKLGAALVAGGAAKQGLSMVGWGGDSSTPLKNFAWGGVDALAMVSGAGVRDKMMAGFEKNLTTTALKDMAFRGGVTDMEKLALIEGKSGTAGLQALTGMLEKDASKLTGANLRELAVKAGVTETATLDALASKSGQEGLASLNGILTQSAGAPFRDATVPLADTLSAAQLREMAVAGGITDAKALAAFEGKSGLEGLKTATALLTERTTAAQKAADTALTDAVKAAPWYQKPLVWGQGHSPLLWRIPTKSLEGYKTAQIAADQAMGSRWNYMNPLNVVASPTNYSGTLRNLEARTWWNRYKIDAVSIGATSGVYRGFHEAARVGDIDPATGNKYSAYDAVTSTLKGTALDGLSGGFIVGGFRGMGGFFTKHSGVAAEANPLVKPTAPAALPAEAGLGSKVMQGGRYAWYYGAKMPRYGLDLVGKKAGDFGTGAGQWISESPRTSTFLGAFPTTGVLFSPKLYEAYGAYEKAGEYEKILAEIQKPLEDKTPVTPLPGSDKPAEQPAQKANNPPANVPADKPPDKPADKPADQQPANPQPGAKSDGVGEGLPE